ncbi:hypothetical protein L211DRAFT_849432 [Terfezia boudieri ATCC MYA-4762]|uniref:Uncharacterized protein n=1 Tax=Terfezia boudieri ATCC MYA-4762 TaxID=1051890 RepID=A0A3N4LRE2_9PEZI|nr:hypothetical protein L211DRAFT_849432 [Terfezia boudieri ATCC MYA-4762]
MTSEPTIPAVSWDEIASFRDRHFSTAAQLSFFTHFTPVTNPSITEKHVEADEGECYDNMDYAYEEREHEEEDDNLGYYPDGVKRTLTDAQIAIFRHSEIQEMLKAKRKALLAAEAAAAEPAEAKEMEARESLTEDYSTHDRRSRPMQAGTGALPWDDEDVGAWEDTQQQQQDSLQGRRKGKEVPALVRKPVVKPTFDAPSGKQFFWPVIEK